LTEKSLHGERGKKGRRGSVRVVISSDGRNLRAWLYVWVNRLERNALLGRSVIEARAGLWSIISSQRPVFPVSYRKKVMEELVK